jgi:hypothetical protein
MEELRFIPVEVFIQKYNVSQKTFNYFLDNDLVTIVIQDNSPHIAFDQLDDLLAMCRLYNDFTLECNAMEIIVNMRKRLIEAEEEILRLRATVNRLEEDRTYRLLDIPGRKGMIIEIES